MTSLVSTFQHARSTLFSATDDDDSPGYATQLAVVLFPSASDPNSPFVVTLEKMSFDPDL